MGALTSQEEAEGSDQRKGEKKKVIAERSVKKVNKNAKSRGRRTNVMAVWLNYADNGKANIETQENERQNTRQQ